MTASLLLVICICFPLRLWLHFNFLHFNEVNEVLNFNVVKCILLKDIFICTSWPFKKIQISLWVMLMKKDNLTYREPN